MTEATERVLVSCPTYKGKAYALDAYVRAYNDFQYPYRGLFLVDNTGIGLDYFEQLRKLKVPCDHLQPNGNWQATFAQCWKRILREAKSGGYQWVASIEQDNICPPLTLDILLNVAGYCRAVLVAHSYPWHEFQAEAGELMGLGCTLILTELLEDVFAQEKWYTDAFEGEIFAYPQLHKLTTVEVRNLVSIRHLDGREGEEFYTFARETIPQFTPGHTTVYLPPNEKERREKMITDEFHQLYYFSDHTWNGGNTRWKGVPVLQTPLDMWVLQEIIHETKPDIIVETGTAVGGSALYYTDVFEGQVISVDTQAEMQPAYTHSRVQFVKGSSIDPAVMEGIASQLDGKRVMVVLDSDHTAEHVAREMELYAPLVTPECYLVVCDTNLGGNPIQNAAVPGGGPMQAVRQYLELHSDLVADKSREKFYMTFCPNGWLRKVR